MKYQVLYTRKAKKDLQTLDVLIARKIAKKIRTIIEEPNPLKHAKELKGNYKGLFRFRIGVYRAIFTKDKDGKITILNIIRIQHRKDIYQ